MEIAIKGLGWKPIIELPKLWGDEGVEETKEDDKTQIKIEKSEFLKMAKEGVEIAKISNPSGSIIGAMVDSHNNSGHIMVVVPGEMIDTENENKWGDSFKKRNITKVPIVVECGQGVRNFVAPLCKNVDARGAIERLKWYKYKLAK